MHRSAGEVSPFLFERQAHSFTRAKIAFCHSTDGRVGSLANRCFLIAFYALTNNNTLYRTIMICYSSFAASQNAVPLTAWLCPIGKFFGDYGAHVQISSAVALSRFAGQK